MFIQGSEYYALCDWFVACHLLEYRRTTEGLEKKIKFSRSCLRARKRRNLNWYRSSNSQSLTRQVCNFSHFTFMFIV